MNLYGMGGTFGVRFPAVGGIRKGILLASFALLLGVRSNAEAADDQLVDRDAFLKAVAEVETGGNPRAVGRQGERGMYQFRKATWQQHSTRSFFEAHNPVVSYEVAASHFDWLYEGFVRNGRKPSLYLMAAAWNAGLTRTLKGNAPSATRSYARRVANIAASIAPRPAAALLAQNRFFVPSAE